MVFTPKYKITKKLVNQADKEHIRPLKKVKADLTQAQSDIMALFTRGLTNKEISNVVGLSPNTVQRHRQRIMERIGVNSTQKLMAWGILHGYWKA